MNNQVIFKIKKILIAFLLLIGFGSVVHYALATSAQSSSGWAWGGTPSLDGTYQGMGWISFNDTNAGSGGGTYGVNIPPGNGPLSGYAWSGNGYGWISFNGADLAGCDPALGQATRTGNNITGGARILAIRDAVAAGNAGGFDGCISLAGVSVVGTSLAGFAWSSDLGWIDMSGVIILIPEVNILVNPCTIPAATSTCSTATTVWTFNNAAPDYRIMSDTTGDIIYNGDSGDSSIGGTQLHYGSNTIYGYHNNLFAAGQHIGSRTLSVDCISGAQWSSLASVCANPPDLTVTANPKFIRSGATTTITTTVTSPNEVNCTVLNATTGSPDSISHPGAAVPTPYTLPTKNIKNKQIITVNCTDTVTGLTASATETIEVAPTIQEI